MYAQKLIKGGFKHVVTQIIFWLKALLLTEALTHALRSWVIFAPARNKLYARFEFLARLGACFECSSVWGAAASIFYLYFLDFWPLTLLLIISRWSNVLHIFIDWLDALRASTTNKI